MTEVILKREVPRLGDRGQVVRVADGFARNYLYPQQLAIPATPASMKNLKEMRAAADREAARLKGDAEKLAEALQSLTIKIVGRAGESNQLFGSVTSRDIVAEIEKQGYTVDRHKIFLDRPIRLVGDHAVKVHLHRDIDLKLLVKVRAEGREDEEITAQAEVAEEEAETEVVEGEPETEVAEAAEEAEEAKPQKSRAKSTKKSDSKRAKQEEDEE